MFDLQSVDTADKKFSANKYLSYGVQELKINKLEIKVAGTGSKQIIFFMEGRPVKEEGFEGVDGAQGCVGKVTTMYYKEESEKDGVMILGKIADALGVRDKFNSIEHKDFTSLVEGCNKVLTGKFAAFAIGCTQEVGKDNNKIYNKLRFTGKFDFVETVGTTPSKLKFDKENKYHFTAAVLPDNIGTSESKTAIKQKQDSLPF